jgi:aspartate kinase
MLLVKKYGGSSVSTPEKIVAIAQQIKNLVEQGHKLIVVVSAMGETTDELVDLSRRITLTPVQREMDMLLSSGERISMALLAMALNHIKCPAISFTGSQSGVFTDPSHSNARIYSIKAIRVEEELGKNRVVIIAGFQGVNPLTKEITTLGRGGSDTTAVAMAAQFKAERCDILTDVRGLFSIDPRIPGVTPQHLPELDYAITLEMAYWGARVLHYRSVELAERSQIPLLVHLSSEEGSGTLIKNMEETQYKAVNYNSSVGCIEFEADYDLHKAFHCLKEGLIEKRLPTPQLIYQRQSEKKLELFISAPEEHFDGIIDTLKRYAENEKLSIPKVHTHWSTVSLTGRGFVNSTVLFELVESFEESAIKFETIITTPLTFSFIVHQNQVQLACQILHEKFIKKLDPKKVT